jgi:hypothetical protein
MRGEEKFISIPAAVRLKSRREKKPKVIRWKGLVRRRHLIAVMHYSRQTVGTNPILFRRNEYPTQRTRQKMGFSFRKLKAAAAATHFPTFWGGNNFKFISFFSF